jgi:uncharacterized membrane protein YeaQ/YmgE (transglycosylase-associated protein family)
MVVLAWIVFGLIAGMLAKRVMPESDPGWTIVTILLTVTGGFVGGFMGAQLGYGGMTGLALRSTMIAAGGALPLVIGCRMLVSRTVA